MDYPDKQKIHIYVCDDGNRSEMKQLCEELGVSYLARKDHANAKAGNYNYALLHTNSELIVTFDADMIPMHDFLLELVPYFKTDTIGFVQSPQSFYNPDLFQFNLYSENLVPNEQDFFFRHIQLSRNATNTAIYGGSNTILRRKALVEAGGFSTVSITEDLATGLMIQSLGYQGVAVGDVHASGLSPTEIDSLLKQRERWARGCIQTIKKLKVITNKKLTRQQKRSYFLSVVYWYVPLRRMIFILAPILYSFFDVSILECSFWELLVFFLPQFILFNSTLKEMNGSLRSSRLTNLYDTILAPYLLPAILLETFGVHKMTFHVTNKSHTKQKEDETKRFARKYSIIFVILLVLDIFGAISCVNKLLFERNVGVVFVLYWLIANGYHLVMAIYFTFGRSSYRESTRITLNIPMVIETNQYSFLAKSLNISEGGAAFIVEEPEYIPPEEIIKVSFAHENSRYQVKLSAHICHVEHTDQGFIYAIQFEQLPKEDLNSLWMILYDRVPNMPDEINKRSSYFEDMQMNYKRRKQKQLMNHRKLPRISLLVTCYTNNRIPVDVKEFSFEYMVLSGTKEEELVIYSDSNPSLNFKLKKVKNNNDGQQLYHVLNYQELVRTKEFRLLLNYWMKESKEKYMEQQSINEGTNEMRL